jgi:pimeloyl-ACP methyl ester carboxylesterase
VSHRRSSDGATVHRTAIPPHIAIRSWDATHRDKTVLLLHGATSSSRTWWRVAPSLSQLSYHVMAVDLPGHGETPTGQRPTTPRTMAERVLGVLDSTPIDILVGHSLGSMVAAELLDLAPDAARSLILDEPPGLMTVQWNNAVEQLHTEQPAARQDPLLHADRLHRNLPGWNIEDCAIAVEDLIACDLDAVADVLRALASGSTHALVPRLDVPTLLMLGPDTDGDYVFGGEYGSSIRGTERRQFIHAVPASTTRVFGVGHVLHRDAPDEWIRHIATFAAE